MVDYPINSYLLKYVTRIYARSDSTDGGLLYCACVPVTAMAQVRQ